MKEALTEVMCEFYEGGLPDLERKHPLWKERFENIVRANSEKAAAMGIVLKKISCIGNKGGKNDA
jgi:hypothetical protein